LLEIESITYRFRIGQIGTLINYFDDVLPPTRWLTRPVCPKCDQAYMLKDYLLAWCCTQRSVRSFIVLVGAVIACVLLVFCFSFRGENFVR
jgi:hypothetical protein